jgi:hypothetical protein
MFYMAKYQSYWRGVARPIIAEVLKTNKGKPEKEIRKALHDAYPFGERKYHPYKIWLNEINLQLGKAKLWTPGRKKKVTPMDPNQTSFFEK